MIKNRIIFAGLAVFALFMLGCTSLVSEPAQSQPREQQYLCNDGQTIVGNLADCPKVDMDIKECDDADSSASYGPSDRDVCYYELAVERENATLCRKIRNTDSWYDYTAARCGAEIAMFKGDAKVCEELSFLSKYDCYLELAAETEDASICGEITSESKADDCYSSLASQLYDPSICSFISSDQDRDDCIYNYVSWNSWYVDDWKICEDFSDSAGYEQDYCYYLAAEETGELSYCDNIEGIRGSYYTYTQADCYATVAKGDRKPSTCEKLTDAEDKDDCYYKYATSYPYDESVCENIKDQELKDDCKYWASDDYYYY